MKLNIAFPVNGTQKMVDIDDAMIAQRIFVDKRIGAEVGLDLLGPEWDGYVVRINGGNDKQGFPMKQGVLASGRVRLLLRAGQSCYRERRNGQRRRKSVHGCIVTQNIQALSVSIVKRGTKEIPGLTDAMVPRRLGPKRASKIRTLFNLTKDDDVRNYVIKRPLPKKEGKKQYFKGPKIQRLVTPLMLQHKRQRMAEKKKRAARRVADERDYALLLAKRQKEKTEKVKAAKEKKKQKLRSLSSSSTSLGSSGSHH